MGRREFCFVFLAAFWVAGCQRDKIQTYDIPKEVAAPAGMGMEAAPGMTAAASPKEIEWKVPTSWDVQPMSSMRVGSFLAKSPDGGQADISVVPLSGQAGGDLSNINRWRGQLQLAPITQDDLPKQSQTISPAGRSMLLVDFTNGQKRLTAAIYKHGEQIWFFKMIGDDAAVRDAKPAFMRFLESLHFHSHD